jgi:integrase/recombinase XerD
MAGIQQNVYKLFTNGLNHGKELILPRYRYSSPKVRLYNMVKKDGTCGIYIQLIVLRKVGRIPLYIDVRPEDFENGRIRNHVKSASENNLLIDNALARINEINTDYRLARNDLSLDKLLHEYHHWETRFCFLTFMEQKIKERKGSVSAGTTEQHENILKKLRAFKAEIIFSDLNLRLLNEYNLHLKTTLKNNHNTRRKEFENLKIFTNLAINAGIRIKDPFKGFTLPEKSDRIIFLVEEELKRLIEYFYKPGIPAHHKRALRGFLFMCFTGLRYSDAVRANRKMMFGDMLILIPNKSRKKGLTVNIPITQEAKNFMNGIGDKLIHYYTGWQANKYLKQIAALLDINKNITNHVGRHTFATLFLMRGGNVVTLQSLLGHSDIHDTMKYVHIVDQYKAEQMKDAWAGMVPQGETKKNMPENFMEEYKNYKQLVEALNNPVGWKNMFLRRMEKQRDEFRIKYAYLLNDKYEFIED